LLFAAEKPGLLEEFRFWSPVPLLKQTAKKLKPLLLPNNIWPPVGKGGAGEKGDPLLDF